MIKPEWHSMDKAKQRKKTHILIMKKINWLAVLVWSMMLTMSAGVLYGMLLVGKAL